MQKSYGMTDTPCNNHVWFLTRVQSLQPASPLTLPSTHLGLAVFQGPYTKALTSSAHLTRCKECTLSAVQRSSSK